MLLAVLAVAALAWWLHREGVLLPNLLRLGGAAAAGLLAFRLLTSGRIVLALAAAAAGFAWWAWSGKAKILPASRDIGQTRQLASAAKLLGVPADAGSDVIWQAWRRAMATAHPDAGGSDAQAQALTDARDLLVAAAEKRRETGR
ncbi:hypothetical protein [Sandarakinorhabdus sp.]|uniref:hypothetical protein n=1 Tax=Sandarakinorhabdus sp. TaxID=1916663 RepID=UPI0033414118